MNQDLVSYFTESAKEYQDVYLNPDEQEDLLEATKIFQDLFAQKTVLEIACGTGYWTERIAKTATSILGTDINESMIEIAKQRQTENMAFGVADMFNLAKTRSSKGFSQVLYEVISYCKTFAKFLEKVKSFLKPNATVFIIGGNPLSN